MLFGCFQFLCFCLSLQTQYERLCGLFTGPIVESHIRGNAIVGNGQPHPQEHKTIFESESLMPCHGERIVESLRRSSSLRLPSQIPAYLRVKTWRSGFPTHSRECVSDNVPERAKILTSVLNFARLDAYGARVQGHCFCAVGGAHPIDLFGSFWSGKPEERRTSNSMAHKLLDSPNHMRKPH
jgi:hypothetical protein